jgi:hypothetical protein
MSYQVFISYRRKDQPAPVLAEWLYDRLVPEVGLSGVFFDRDELEEGDDFPERLRHAVEEAVVFIALIGPQWNTVNPQGERRLDNPRDFVRREVARALECKEADSRRLILSVLFDGAPFPSERDLPDCLHSLTRFNGCALESPYHEGLSKIVQSAVRKVDEFDSIPAEEKWILQQIGNTLPSDRHRVRQIGKELKERFDIIPAVPESARSLARALYLVGPEALQYLSPLGSHDAQINALLKLLATHWIKPDTARDLQNVFTNSPDGKMAAIECEYPDFTPDESLLKASHDVCGWPTVSVNRKDEIEEILQQVHEKLLQEFQLNTIPRRTRTASALPLSSQEQREKINRLLLEYQPLPMVLHLDHLMALDQNLIRRLREAFPPLHILVAADDPEELKVVGRFAPIPITKPAEADEDEERAYRAYGEACRRLRAIARTSL